MPRRLPQPAPTLWLGQSVDTSSICSAYADLKTAPFLTSLGCAIRRPSLARTHFNSNLRDKLGISGPLMVDSGGFVLSTKPRSPWSFRAVSNLIDRVSADIFVSLDFPPSASDSAVTRREKILASTRNFARLSERFPDKTIMPVVHGRTISEIELSTSLLIKKVGKQGWIGVGGMVPLLQQRQISLAISEDGPEMFIGRALAVVRKAFPYSKIHVFGAGGTRTFPAVYALGADSADSIGWRHAAGFGSIFLPLKSQRVVKWNRENAPPRKTLDDSDLAQLEMCRCPICRVKSSTEEKLAAFRKGFHERSIHNAWTLTNQTAYWPSSRSQMLNMLASGMLGGSWAKAAASAG